MQFYPLIRRVVKFHRPLRMSAMPPSRVCSPIGGSFYLANHPTVWQNHWFDSLLSHNEMHFKYSAFWSFKTFISPRSELVVWGSAALKQLGFSISSVQCIYRSLHLYWWMIKTKLSSSALDWLKAFSVQDLESWLINWDGFLCESRDWKY